MLGKIWPALILMLTRTSTAVLSIHKRARSQVGHAQGGEAGSWDLVEKASTPLPVLLAPVPLPFALSDPDTSAM